MEPKGAAIGPGRQAQRWGSWAHLVQSPAALPAPAERVGGGWSAETCGTRRGWGTERPQGDIVLSAGRGPEGAK